jgi:PAS domain S-box-containing protein
MSLFKRNKDSKKNTPNSTNYSSTPNNILVDNELKKENSNQTSLFNEKETIKKNLFSKPPETWTIYEVGSWLALLDFTEYRIPFVENNISGLELLDLTDQDLISLQINKLGDRKKLLKYIQLLKDGDSQKKISDDSSIDSEEKDLTDGTHSLSLDGEITIKCYYEDDVHMIDITNPSLSELEKKISEEFQLSEFVIKYKDNEDELITIQKDKDLIRALKNGKSNETPKLIIFKKSFLTESQIQTYNALADAVVIFDKKGYIQFLNINGEKLFEYSREKIIGKSFKLFLSEEDGKNFFSTLKKYRKLIQKDFGNVKIVSCKKSDGTIFFASLSINEIKETQNFIALFHLIEERELKKTEENKNYTNFNVLDGLSDATVVINDQGNLFLKFPLLV